MKIPERLTVMPGYYFCCSPEFDVPDMVDAHRIRKSRVKHILEPGQRLTGIDLEKPRLTSWMPVTKQAVYVPYGGAGLMMPPLFISYKKLWEKAILKNFYPAYLVTPVTLCTIPFPESLVYRIPTSVSLNRSLVPCWRLPRSRRRVPTVCILQESEGGL